MNDKRADNKGVYRVTLVSDAPIASDRPCNPFYIRDIFSYKVRRAARVWEIEAESEAEVLRFYQEAKAQDLPNVRGFSLERIEAIPQPCEHTFDDDRCVKCGGVA